MAIAVSTQASDSSVAERHRDALDGIRGIAISVVIGFHSLKFYSGWAGVQIFFVLSGFLITSILLKDSDLPANLYFKRFYWRRSLRIFPLYFGYLLVMAVIYALYKVPSVFGRDWPYLITYTLNFRRVWPDFGSNGYYGRFWTLAVEEQFYLIWPLLVYYFPRKYFPALVASILIFSPICRALTGYLLAPYLHTDFLLGSAAYYLTPGQMDSFALGAGLVLIANRLRKRAVLIFIACTVLFLVCGQIKTYLENGRFIFDSGFGYGVSMFRYYQHIWGYTVINLWAASLILAATAKNWIAKILAFPPLAYIGKISYGMYVYHQIILHWGLQRFGSFTMNTRHGFVTYFLVVTLVSALSFHLYESLFLALKDRRFARPKPKRDRFFTKDPAEALVLRPLPTNLPQ